MKTILLIEDDAALRENTAELLELSDYKVFTAQNGKIGIEKARQIKPDIIVCDIMMPEVDGYGVLEAVTADQNLNAIPFIFLSAKTEHNQIRKGMNLGADDYLTKPFDEDDLLSAIESRLAKASILSKLAKSKNTEQTPSQAIGNLNELKNLFCDEGEVSKFKRGEIIYAKGDYNNNLFLILKGVVKTHNMDMNGKELITTLYKADDFVGFSSIRENTPHNETATAVDDTELVAISKKYVADLLKSNQDVSLELMNVLADNLEHVKEQLLNMAYSSVKKKTASTILQFVDIMNRKTSAIKISRSDLAATAGIATESLIRTLSDFKKDGIIEIQGRNITVIDAERLRSIE